MSRNVFVFSGGGSRGAAQVGMLRALLGAGITPDLMVGASVGAMNACYLACDPTPERVESLADRWMAMREEDLIGPRRTALANLARRRPYLFDSRRLRALVSDWLPVSHLQDLPVPVRVATTDLTTGSAVHHDAGRAGDIIAASAALPGIFPPVLLDTGAGPRPHVDAGIAENVPLSGALGLVQPGDRIWALDVTKRANPRTLRNPLDVVIAALTATVSRQPLAAAPNGVDVVHCHLDETFDCGPVFDFGHTGTLFRLGEQAAVAVFDAHQGPSLRM